MPILQLSSGAMLLPEPTQPSGFRFQVVRQLGAGGFSITYVAEDAQLGDQCVIKELGIVGAMHRDVSAGTILPAEGCQQDVEYWIEKVIREARLLNKIRGEGVVGVRATWRENGTAYIAMDLIEGIELPHAPSSEHDWPVWEPVLLKVLDALGSIHAAGIIHGDLKPSNVLIRRDGRPVLIDFGTARSADDLKKTRVTTVAFSPGYSPPEVEVRERASEVGPWTDLYSFGMLALGLMVPHPGLDGEPLTSRERTTFAHHGLSGAGYDDRIWNAMRARGVPEGWIEGIRRCIELDPAARPRTVAELLASVSARGEAPVLATVFGATPPVAVETLEPRGVSPNGLATPPVAASEATSPAAAAAAPAPDPDRLGIGPHETAEAPRGRTGSVPARPSGGSRIGVVVVLLLAVGGLAAWLALRPRCGDGALDEGETCESCPADAACAASDECVEGVCQPRCGNERIDEGENCATCVADSPCGVGEACSQAGVCGLQSCPAGFATVPAGRFTMGSDWVEPEWFGVTPPPRDEQPHDVTISRGFCLGQTEVTQATWVELMGSNPSRFKACGSDCPVDNVSWLDAANFANRWSDRDRVPRCYADDGTFSGLDCRGYRLPTEAEWEFAARAGTETDIYTGDLELLSRWNAPALDEIAWWGANSFVSYDRSFPCGDWRDDYSDLLMRFGQIRWRPTDATCGTLAVGRKAPNRLGLHDMLGNVWEWTQDSYGPYPSSPEVDPVREGSSSKRVYRGGGFSSSSSELRASKRKQGDPSKGGNFLGFRVARTLAPR
jgi:formylglycine-generating enzyme required for sulfatase activity/serine/threonine protein kinase